MPWMQASPDWIFAPDGVIISGMKIYSWFIAQCYDLTLRRTEQTCLSHWRRELLSQASGDVLEIGAGTGLNLPYYAQNQKLILSEPDPFMRNRLVKKIPIGRPNIQIRNDFAERLHVEDQSIDTVVSTLVLCSVNSQERALQEIVRVLKPGGQLLFLEHVLSDCPKTACQQHQFEPFWRPLSGNCHLTRDTAGQIEKNGLFIQEIKESSITGAPKILRKAIRGQAIKRLPTASQTNP